MHAFIQEINCNTEPSLSPVKILRVRKTKICYRSMIYQRHRRTASRRFWRNKSRRQPLRPPKSCRRTGNDGPPIEIKDGPLLRRLTTTFVLSVRGDAWPIERPSVRAPGSSCEVQWAWQSLGRSSPSTVWLPRGSLGVTNVDAQRWRRRCGATSWEENMKYQIGRSAASGLVDEWTRVRRDDYTFDPKGQATRTGSDDFCHQSLGLTQSSFDCTMS